MRIGEALKKIMKDVELMARFTFKLPDIGEGISEAEIVAWHVAVGDRIEEDQQIADMMTDKATVEMESPVSGTVIELAGEVGDQVSIGAALVVIETEGNFSASEAPALEPVTDEVKVAPLSSRTGRGGGAVRELRIRVLAGVSTCLPLPRFHLPRRRPGPSRAMLVAKLRLRR